MADWWFWLNISSMWIWTDLRLKNHLWQAWLSGVLNMMSEPGHFVIVAWSNSICVSVQTSTWWSSSRKPVRMHLRMLHHDDRWAQGLKISYPSKYCIVCIYVFLCRPLPGGVQVAKPFGCIYESCTTIIVESMRSQRLGRLSFCLFCCVVFLLDGVCLIAWCLYCDSICG